MMIEVLPHRIPRKLRVLKKSRTQRKLIYGLIIHEFLVCGLSISPPQLRSTTIIPSLPHVMAGQYRDTPRATWLQWNCISVNPIELGVEIKKPLGTIYNMLSFCIFFLLRKLLRATVCLHRISLAYTCLFHSCKHQISCMQAEEIHTNNLSIKDKY